MDTTLTQFDYGVVAFYFLFMLAIGLLFRKFIGNTSDFFRGGGQMAWWMAGSSAFMVQFSAWTFTGAASKAYQDGLLVLVIFLGNAVGFLANYWYFAAKCRQTRVVTAVEAMRIRFGKTAEQVFTWLQLPIGTLYAGIWLNGLGVFFSAVFGFDIATTVLVTGLVVLILSVTGGSWAVVASDFMQVLVLMPISVVAAFFALKEVGGVGELVERFPADRFWGGDTNYSTLIWIWVVVILLKQFASTNNLMDASRYLCARDSKEARKGALLASALFVIGPAVWFIPPMASAILYPDLGEMFPQLKKPEEASYVAICIMTLPAGMLGLLMSGIFAATMSSMDSGLNRNAGIFVRNFYLPILRPQASEKELLLVSKVSTVVFGLCIIVAGIQFSQLKDIGLFDLMLQFGALIAIPMQVPLIWGILVKKVPDWASWVTILVGLCVSFVIKTWMTPDWIQGILGLDTPFSGREGSDLSLILGVVINLTIGSAVYLGSTVFYKDQSEHRKKEVDDFFVSLNTPVEASETGSAERDSSQGKALGILSMIYGGFVFLLAAIPNPLLGRLAFVFCGLVLLGIGYALAQQGKGKAKA
ncbi:Na+:solute symporter [Pelagicoccus sp. NFK12]|uniref:Na+:solute symporter n=1 Tax=Pelagicoccus enzymogenes TaxID=2773457 RepID=A0A927FE47_9BACT|nr:sodium:solute symporter family protein [Pelagicoccus enzymogenes]MBD5782015.1 Na+:solute symporter [Pelagicoccus enzymogenes]MDQ8196770.1 Na+:solute symporter [Pelagicoccus enzymogenes]